MRKYTEAQRRASKKWDEANKDRYKRINLVVHAEMGDEIKHAAAERGQSVNAFIIDCIKYRL